MLFLGQPGCGESPLVVALAVCAVGAGYRGCFSTVDAVVKTLLRADRGGTATTEFAVGGGPVRS